LCQSNRAIDEFRAKLLAAPGDRSADQRAVCVRRQALHGSFDAATIGASGAVGVVLMAALLYPNPLTQIAGRDRVRLPRGTSRC